MAPKSRGRPTKAALAAANADIPPPLMEPVTELPAAEIPPLTEAEEVKEITVCDRTREEPVFDLSPTPPLAETPLTWRQRIVHEILEEEYRALVREQMLAGTLDVDHPEDREMFQEIQELRKGRFAVSATTASSPVPPSNPVTVEVAPTPVTVEVAPTPVTVEVAPTPVTVEVAPTPVTVEVAPTPVTVEVSPTLPASNPTEWAEEFGVLLSTFLQTDKGVTVVEALERQTKVWLRVSQQLERLNGLVASLLHDEEPLDVPDHQSTTS